MLLKLFDYISFIETLLKYRTKLINRKNKSRLRNSDFTLISSNCIGGFIYNWLGLQFKSPFINLYLDCYDFINMLENFDEFINNPLSEDINSEKNYPVAIGYNGVKINFMHYKNFEEANYYWEKRKKRIDKNNLAVWISNFGNDFNYKKGKEDEITEEEIEFINRFNKLPFKNKLIFSGKKIYLPNVIYIKELSDRKGRYLQNYDRKNLYKRYIDQFDYISYLNSL